MVLLVQEIGPLRSCFRRFFYRKRAARVDRKSVPNDVKFRSIKTIAILITKSFEVHFPYASILQRHHVYPATL
jgi:hypothetical protein